LGSIDLRGWNPQAFPKTPEREELVVKKSLVERFLEEPRSEPEEVSQKVPWEDFKAWCNVAPVQCGTMWAFGRDLRKCMAPVGKTDNLFGYMIGKFRLE